MIMKSLKALFAVICLVCVFFPSSVFAAAGSAAIEKMSAAIEKMSIGGEGTGLDTYVRSRYWLLRSFADEETHVNSIRAFNAWLEGKHNSAFQFSKKAEEANDDACFALLGLLYYEGQGVDKDREKAVEYFKKGTTANRLFVSLCYHYLSVYYGRDGGSLKSPQLAFFYAKKCVDNIVDADALSGQSGMETFDDVFLFNLGLMYAFGFGTEPCPELAVKYLRYPAEAGFNESRFLISASYTALGQRGLAFLWALAGAEVDKSGLSTAILADYYEFGFGCKKKLNLSCVLYKHAEQLGYPAADDVARVEKKIRELRKTKLRKTKESTVEKK